MVPPTDPVREQTDSTLTSGVSDGNASIDPTETHAYTDGAPAPATTELPHIPGYEVLGELGRGAIGLVYKARQIALNRVVAIKLIGGIPSAATLIRFRQEAEAVAKLQHPNIIQIFEVGSCLAGSFLALEYVDGGTLKEKVAGVPQAPRDAALMAETLARAVHHAHEQRLIHRDLKPSNVLLTSGRVPKVADFGLARSLDAGGGVTVTADFVGTPSYAAPEQVAAQFGEVGPTTDVYALGAILYELITGRVPFLADAIPVILRMVAEQDPISPRRLKSDIPRDLNTICLKCLQKDPGKRYGSASELAEDLHRFQAGESIAARPIGRVERLTRWAKRHPAVAGLVGAVFALLTVLAVGGAVFSLKLGSALRDSERDRKQAERDRGQAERDRDAARRAEQEGKETLLQSLISEAKADRFSRRVGQRFSTLETVQNASRLAHELEKPAETFNELRNLTIAALALPDLKPDSAWISTPTDIDTAWGKPVPDPAYRRVAIEHQRGAVSIRRIGTGPNDCGEIARLPGLGTEVKVRWGADSRYLAVWHWPIKRLQVWLMETDQPKIALDIKKACMALEFTPDGKQLITVDGTETERGGPQVIRIYDLDTGKSSRTLPLPPGATLTVSNQLLAHHPYRSELAVGLPSSVAIIDLTDGKQIGRLPTVSAAHMVWHPDGEHLGVAFYNHVEMWDVPRRRVDWRLENIGEGTALSFNKTGELLVTSGWAKRVRLWNAHTGREVLSTTGIHNQFGVENRLMLRFPSPTSDPAGPTSVVEPAPEYRTFTISMGRGSINGMNSCSIHPKGRLLAVSCYQGIGLVDLVTGAERAFIPGSSCRQALFEPDGSLLVRSGAGLYRWPVVFDPTDPTSVKVGPPELVPVPARGERIARSADGTVLAVSELGDGLSVWHRDRPYDALRLFQADCRHVAVSPDGKLVAAGSWSGRGIKVWEVETGRPVRTLLPNEVFTIPIFSPDGVWLCNYQGQRWRVSDWSDGPRAPAGTSGVGFSPDGRLAAWSGKGFIALTDSETGRELARLEDPHQDQLNWPTFSADGSQLMGTTNDSFCVRVWDLRKIRQGLAERDLDWKAPPYPPAPAVDADVPLLKVQVIGEGLTANVVQMRQRLREQAILAVWLSPLDPNARLALGDQMMKSSRYREAAIQFTAAIAILPDQTGAYFQRMLARQWLGDWDGSVADADVVLAKRPGDWLARWYRAHALVQLARHADAVAELTRLTEFYSYSAGIYLKRAEAYRALGKLDEAAPDWKRAAELVDQYTPLLEVNNIAWRLVSGPQAARDPKLGLELARQVNDKQAATSVFLNTLGVALYRNDLFEEALPVLERSLALSRGAHDGADLYFLAMCHAKLGDSANALRSYRRADEWIRKNPKRLDPDEEREFRTEAESTLHAAGLATDPAPPPREK